MLSRRMLKCLPIVLVSLLVSSSRGYASRAGTLADSADLIVVASATSAVQAVGVLHVTLKIERVLKGSVNAGSLVGTRFPVEEGLKLGAPKGCGLWFLSGVGGASTAIRVDPGQGQGWHYLPLGSCVAPATYSYEPTRSPVDKVICEIAENAEYFRGRLGWDFQIYSLLAGDASALAGEVARRFALSPTREWRAVGLALQVASGDEAALARIEPELAQPFPIRSNARGLLISSISAYKNQTPSGITALGRLATSPTVEFLARRAAAWSLMDLHTKEALPFYRVLLDDPKQEMRECAVNGFSRFRMGIPVGLRSPEWERTADRLMNPGYGTLKGADRENIHLGEFQSPAQEAAIIAFYKTWWSQNRGRLGF